MSYACSGEPFLLVRTQEAGDIYISWDNVEACSLPILPQMDETSVMEEHGITFDGSRYQYECYKYDKLEDAINYARQQMSKSR